MLGLWSGWGGGGGGGGEGGGGESSGHSAGLGPVDMFSII